MQRSKKFWNFRNEAEAETAELLLYGDIANETWYGDEATPKQFAEDLDKCGGKPLNVRINSPGGDVFAAHAIYNQLKDYAGDVSITIDGMCASAATIVACAGGHVTMPSNAVYMIHNPACFVMDYMTADDAQGVAKQLDTVKNTIIAVYHDRVNGALTDKKIAKLMDAETWMSAQEALDNGFIDEVAGGDTVENMLDGSTLIVNSVSVSLKKYKNTAHLRDILNKKGAQNVENDVLSKIKNLLGIKETPQQSVEDKAVQQERERVAALDALRNGKKSVDAIVETAKKNGQTAEQVQAYVEAMPDEDDTSKKALDAIRELIMDETQSGADEVKPAPQLGAKATQAAKTKSEIDEIAEMMNKLRKEH